MTTPISIRTVGADERAAWEPLWKGYQTLTPYAAKRLATNELTERANYCVGNTKHFLRVAGIFVVPCGT